MSVSPAHAALAVAAVLAALLATLVVPASAEADVSYLPPVDGPVITPFQPPSSPYGPGNRGIDYATEVGEAVRASAAGEVTFAGRVGLGLHVVVLHPDGIRTSYSFLASVAVRRGDVVEQGQVVGTAGSSLHFGARVGDQYVDPALLLGGGPLQVHLVPVELREPLSEAEERAGLLSLILGSASRVAVWGPEAVAWAAGGAEDRAGWALDVGWTMARDELVDRWTKAMVVSAYLRDLNLPFARAWQDYRRAELFLRSQEKCTPLWVTPPRPPTGDHIAVLVAGLGSDGVGDSVAGVDTSALGFDPANVVQFSYGVEVAKGDIAAAAQRLHRFLQDIGAAHPGATVDVIAHSMGGVLARQALQEPGPPTVGDLITLGSPHHGADLATANALVGSTTSGQVLHAGVAAATGGTVDGGSVAAGQLAETSALIRSLEGQPLPAGVRVTSIAAQGDLVVPALNSALAGASGNVLVGLEGPAAHGELPSSPEAAREMALALAGLPPTCRQLTGGLVLAGAIGLAEDVGGMAAGSAALWADARFHLPPVPVLPED